MKKVKNIPSVCMLCPSNKSCSKNPKKEHNFSPIHGQIYWKVVFDPDGYPRSVKRTWGFDQYLWDYRTFNCFEKEEDAKAVDEIIWNVLYNTNKVLIEKKRRKKND